MSGQHCENYDVKRETVHCYPRNVDRCCTWSLESQRSFQILLFVLFCYITNHLMTGPLRNSEFCFLWISMFLLTSSWETLRFLGNKIHCSPQDQSLSVNYTTTSVLVLSWTWFGWKVQEWHGEYDCEIENCLIRCAFWIADIYVQCD